MTKSSAQKSGNDQTETTCYGCGLVVDAEGVPHPYIGAAQGCWNIYGDILAKEFGEYEYPQPTHRLTVDTYAVQHPGVPGKKSIQSVNIHLLSLYFVLVKKIDGKKVTQMMGQILEANPDFVWLDPPIPNGHIKVDHIKTAINLEDHILKVEEWAQDVWRCWYIKHKIYIDHLVSKLL